MLVTNLVLSASSTFYHVSPVFCFLFAATSKEAPRRDYSLEPSESSRIFSAFTSISIIAAIYGNGILPEIQVGLSC